MKLGDTRQIKNRYLKEIEAMKLSLEIALGFKVLIDQCRA